MAGRGWDTRALSRSAKGVGPPAPPGSGGRAGILVWGGGEGVGSWVTCREGEAKCLGSFPASLLNHCDPGEGSSTMSSLAPL